MYTHLWQFLLNLWLSHKFCTYLDDPLSNLPSPFLGFILSNDLYTVWNRNLCLNLDHFENKRGVVGRCGAWVYRHKRQLRCASDLRDLCSFGGWGAGKKMERAVQPVMHRKAHRLRSWSFLLQEPSFQDPRLFEHPRGPGYKSCWGVQRKKSDFWVEENSDGFPGAWQRKHQKIW